MAEEEKCTCEDGGEEHEPCPYRVELADPEDGPIEDCACCAFCRGNCADDI